MLNFIVLVLVLGFCLYLVNALIPMPPVIKKIINAMAALFLVLTAFQVLGLIDFGINIPRIGK